MLCGKLPSELWLHKVSFPIFAPDCIFAVSYVLSLSPAYPGSKHKFCRKIVPVICRTLGRFRSSCFQQLAEFY